MSRLPVPVTDNNYTGRKGRSREKERARCTRARE